MEDHSCILIVEDEPLVAEGLREVMDELDLGTCQVAQSVDEAVRTAWICSSEGSAMVSMRRSKYIIIWTVQSYLRREILLHPRCCASSTTDHPAS